MAVITVDDWTGKLVGVNETDFSLRASGGQFTAPGNWHAHDGSALFHVHGAEGTGNALDTVGAYHVTPSAWGAAGAGLLADKAIATSYNKVSAVPQLNPCADFVMEAWFYRASTAGNYGQSSPLHLQQSQDYGHIWFWYTSYPGVNDPRFKCEIKEGGSPATQVNVAKKLAEGWKHWAMERYNNRLYAYIDGVLQNAGGTDCTLVDTVPTFQNYSGNSIAAEGWLFQDIYGAQAAEHGGATFYPHVFEASSVVTGATAFDSATPGALWSSVTVTCPARTSNEVYALYVAGNETGTPPAIGGAWTLVASGLTGTSTQALAATGRYCFFKVVHTPDTGSLQQYQIKVDTVAATWAVAPSGGARIVVPTGSVVLGRDLSRGGIS